MIRTLFNSSSSRLLNKNKISDQDSTSIHTGCLVNPYNGQPLNPPQLEISEPAIVNITHNNYYSSPGQEFSKDHTPTESSTPPGKRLWAPKPSSSLRSSKVKGICTVIPHPSRKNMIYITNTVGDTFGPYMLTNKYTDYIAYNIWLHLEGMPNLSMYAPIPDDHLIALGGENANNSRFNYDWVNGDVESLESSRGRAHSQIMNDVGDYLLKREANDVILSDAFDYRLTGYTNF